MQNNIYNLLFIKILLLTANKAEKQKGTSKGHADNGIHSAGGFQMFSMMDFPHKSLQRYSMDPVQSLIYSEDDLGHIDGILADRDVIEDSTIPEIKSTLRLREGENKVSSTIKPKSRLFGKDKKIFLAIEKATQKQLYDIGRIGVKIFRRKNPPVKAKVRNKNKNLALERGFEKQRLSSKKRPKLPKSKVIDLLTSKFSAKRNSPTSVKKQTSRIRSIFRGIKKLPFFYGQPNRNTLKEIQKIVTAQDSIKKPSAKRQKNSRSPEDRNIKIDKMIEKQLKVLNETSNRKERNAAEPNERDFFFFKDAFEYGARLLARKLAKGENDDIKIIENTITEAPNNKKIQENTDLEKIKASVQQNLNRINQQRIEKRLGPSDDNLRKIRPHERESSQNDAQIFTSLPTTETSEKSNDRKNELNVEASNKNNSNHRSNKKSSMLWKLDAFKQLNTEEHKNKDIKKVSITVNSLNEQRKNTEFVPTLKPSLQTNFVLNEMYTESKALSSSSKQTTERTPSVPTTKVIADAVNSAAFKSKKNISTRRRPTRPSSKPVQIQEVYGLPDWKMPPFFYRRPCPDRADVMFRSHDNKVYAIQDKMVYIMGPYGVEIGPMSLQFVWPEVQGPIDDGYVRFMDRMLFLFFKCKYAAYINDRELVGVPSAISAIGLPCSLAPIDAVSSWTGNRRTYYFKDSYYWRYNDWDNRLDTGYPKQIKQHWNKVPDNVDTAFIAPNSYLYFVKGDYIYKMHYYKASVQYRYPKKLSESCYDFFV